MPAPGSEFVAPELTNYIYIYYNTGARLRVRGARVDRIRDVTSCMIIIVYYDNYYYQLRGMMIMI
jgi:hypothetical protein